LCTNDHVAVVPMLAVVCGVYVCVYGFVYVRVSVVCVCMYVYVRACVYVCVCVGSLSWTLGGAGLSRAPRGISLSCCGSPFWWTRCPSTTPSCPTTPRPSCAVCGYVGSWGGLRWGCTLVAELCSVSKGIVCVVSHVLAVQQRVVFTPPSTTSSMAGCVRGTLL
jgi:hypothetical protein